MTDEAAAARKRRVKVSFNVRKSLQRGSGAVRRVDSQPFGRARPTDGRDRRTPLDAVEGNKIRNFASDLLPRSSRLLTTMGPTGGGGGVPRAYDLRGWRKASRFGAGSAGFWKTLRRLPHKKRLSW